MKLNLATLFLLLAGISSSAQPYMAYHLPAQQPPVQQSNVHQYKNPVIPGDFADPTVIRIEDTYYACGTSSEWAPHYPIFESKDLINWSYVGPAFKTKPEWTKASFWAPELYAINGKIYLYYTARRASDGVSYIGVATTDDIRKGFTDHGCLVASGTEAIDAFILEDEGKLYISWKAYGLDPRPIELLCSELSPDGLKLAGAPFTLLKDEENIGMEGQQMFKKGDYYYIIYSIRGCCGANSDYAVSAARSKSLKGPYEKYEGNPILQGDNKEILSCGHGTAVETPEGKLFYLYHAYLKGPGFYNGRQAFLKELAINEAKWPCFVTGNYASIREPMPFKDVKQLPISGFEDRFDGSKAHSGRSTGRSGTSAIRPEWTWNFTFADIRPEIQNNTLFLTGTPLHENKYGSAFCLRTLMPDYEITTEIKDQKNIFSGLTLYGDKDNLILFGKENGKLFLKQVKKGEEQTLYQLSDAGNIHLKISVSDGCYASFYRSTDRKNWTPLPAANQQLNVSYLPPWDRAFRPGLIHIGDENTPAEFTYCRLDYNHQTFTNPLRRGADPYIVKQDGKYYTIFNKKGGFTVTESRFLTRFEKEETVWTPPKNAWNSYNLWAPEIHPINGKWYIYYAASVHNGTPFYAQRTGVLEADNPFGPYTDKGVLYTGDDPERQKDNCWAIDMTVLPYKGKNYAVWSGWETLHDHHDVDQYLYIAELINPWTLGKRILLSKPELEWEKGDHILLQEGPQILQHKEDVFIIYSTRGSWSEHYKLGQLRLKSPDSDPLNPASWIKSEKPVFQGTPTVHGVGHASMTTSPDDKEYWIYYHSKLSLDGGWDNRHVYLQKFTFGKDGNPVFGEPKGGGVMTRPSGENTHN